MMKLSIIVPVYNLEKYIAKTLDSLLTIRFSHDYEIIVVNDGSTDRSEAVIAVIRRKPTKFIFTASRIGDCRARGTMASAKRRGSISPMWTATTR